MFREAARECRRKKKEYIKCLENRVAVLENQNKALIEELKKLKELYSGNGSKSVRLLLTLTVSCDNSSISLSRFETLCPDASKFDEERTFRTRSLLWL